MLELSNIRTFKHSNRPSNLELPYRYGRRRRTRFWSLLGMVIRRSSARATRGALRRRKWLFIPFARRSLPVPVTSKRFAAPEWVFILGPLGIGLLPPCNFVGARSSQVGRRRVRRALCFRPHARRLRPTALRRGRWRACYRSPGVSAWRVAGSGSAGGAAAGAAA